MATCLHSRTPLGSPGTCLQRQAWRAFAGKGCEAWGSGFEAGGNGGDAGAVLAGGFDVAGGDGVGAGV